MKRVKRGGALALVLVMLATGTLYAAGEQLQRAVIGGSGGRSVASNGSTLASVIGAPVGGGVIAGSSGLGLCSGFGCETQGDSGNDDGGGGSSGSKLYLPAIRK